MIGGKGFKQIHGIDYDETFALVTLLKSIWILPVVIAFYDYGIYQMDAKISLFNGNLLEDVYMI